MRRPLFMLILLLPCCLFGQSLEIIDSLQQVLDKEPDHRTAFNTNLRLAAMIMRYDTTRFLDALQAAEDLIESDCDRIVCLNQRLRFASETGLSEEANLLVEKLNALDYSECKQAKAETKVSEGNHFDITGKYTKALEAYLEAEEVYRELENMRGVGLTQMGIGNIYSLTNRNEMAAAYFRKSWQQLKPVEPLYASWSLNNLASTYNTMGLYDSALFYFQESLVTKLELDDEYGASYSYTDIGIVYYNQERYTEALDYLIQSKEIKDRHDGVGDESKSINNRYLGLTYWKLGELTKAREHLEKSVEQSTTSSGVKVMQTAYKALSELQAESGDYQAAYKNHVIYAQMLDSISRREATESLAELQTKFEVKEAKRENELLDAKAKLNAVAIEEQRKENARIKIYVGVAIMIALLFALVGVILLRLNRSRKKANIALNQKNAEIEAQRDEIKFQRDVVAEKNTEILDSINYAKRIQAAILPPDKEFKQHLPNSFILYKPKDIVAGDFYWLESLGDQLMFAAADCTGHGVPGAMVSVICNNGLNRSVREHGLTQPSRILDKTREIVVSEFEKSEEAVQDGMDVALCSLQAIPPTSGSNKGGGWLLQYAGANNPLWVVRVNEHTDEDPKLIEIKPDKQPIGKYDTSAPFTNHEIELEKGDTIYLFSDGYADQFGGEKGKKLKSANMKQLLLSIQGEPMHRQQEILDQKFEEWRGELEQLDDVCVIGIRM